MKKITYTKIKNIALLLATFTLVLTTTFSCSSDDDKDDIINKEPEHEHDEITKIILQFIDKTDTSIVHEFAYEAPEGTTVLPITDVNLPAGTYDVEISFYSPHNDHFHNVTDDIFIDDADDHFVFYHKVNASGLDIVYADDDKVDTSGNKLGHRTIWTLSSGGKATVYIYLLHQPAQKDTNAISTSQLGGEIDLEAHFSLEAE
ncbi:MAG: hypothetical protein LBQ84_07895 [Flavobacteriaceae bacterium]|jgi:hypothetical protein|nr:hypothetical protein [Flavobacteriaceae bacterium]